MSYSGKEDLNTSASGGQYHSYGAPLPQQYQSAPGPGQYQTYGAPPQGLYQPQVATAVPVGSYVPLVTQPQYQYVDQYIIAVPPGQQQPQNNDKFLGLILGFCFGFLGLFGLLCINNRPNNVFLKWWAIGFAVRVAIIVLVIGIIAATVGFRYYDDDIYDDDDF